MFWAHDWLWGLPLLVATVVIHVAIFMVITRALIPEINPSKRRRWDFIVAVALLALFAATLHSLEALAWAFLYVAIGALPDVSTAMFYSLSASTSYGHAEVFLHNEWRLLGSIEAVNGLILFGLTTAFFFAAIQNAWPARER